jgi:hypothetical protein
MRICLYFLLILALVSKAQTATAQLYEISLDQKVSNSTLIIEGKVVDKTSFWNPAHTMIFTANKVEVYKVFKGNSTDSTVEILTQGGTVGDDYIEASDVVSFEKGNIGAFFCYPNAIQLRSPVSGKVLYDVYSSSQGFLKYNLAANKVYAPFVEYDDIEGNFYKLIREKTGTAPRTISSDFKATTIKKNGGSAKVNATATITSFTPAIVVAGALNNPANNVLTIAGSGFGTPDADKQVVFKDANNTTATADYAIEATSPYIISWAENQVVLRVPTRAATGTFGIITAAADTGFSPTNLEVFYAVATATFASTGAVSEPRLMNTNGAGGYTIVYSTNTTGGGTDITKDSAIISIRRALRTWKEVTGANIIESDTTTSRQVVSAGDNLNVIMFDNTNTGNPPIPAGTLAITYSGFSLCGGAAYSQKTGFDMVIRREGVSIAPTGNVFPFNKSYCSPAINTYDFETTVLHEFGHTLNLGHTNDPQEQTSGYTNRNPNKLMHPTVSLSVARKALDQSAYAGALYTITPQNNTGYGSCRFNGEMVANAAIVTPYNECPTTFPSVAIAPGTSVRIDLDHATSNKYRDPQFTAISTAGNASGAGVTVTNNAYYALKTNASGNMQFSITNYATYPPEAQANCPDQGARIALYQVNACPTGQAFPAPVYVTTFNGNTTRNITGLSANSSYLFYFDGVNGTKPTFNITYTGGTTLPVLLSNFYGEKNNAVNNLTIEYQSTGGNVISMVLEKSADGLTFQQLATITLQQHTAVSTTTYVDASPFNGNNYYRLKMTNPDGTIEYSKVVLLKNNLEGQILMYPNPVRDNLTINLSYLAPDKYMIAITDVAGRRVYTEQAGATLVNIPFDMFPKGNYFVQVLDSHNSQVVVNKITK